MIKTIENPDIYYFNPTCEMAIASGTVHFMPNRFLQSFSQDLSCLPFIFSSNKDIILVEQNVSNELKSLWNKAGLTVPEFILNDQVSTKKSLKNKNINELKPWGWSPRMHYTFKNFKPACSPEFNLLPNSNWKEEHKEFYSRKFAQSILKEVLHSSSLSCLIEKSKTAITCYSEEDLENLPSEWANTIIKAPWSSSGRGNLLLHQNQKSAYHKSWIKKTLKTQGYIMAEALLEKLIDISFHFHINADKEIQYLGHAFFNTDENGQYTGNYIEEMPDFQNMEINNFLSTDLLNTIGNDLKYALSKSDLAPNYCGYLGIDAILVRDEKNKLQIHPLLEINLRYNFGTLALFLRKQLHHNAIGLFKIVFFKDETWCSFKNNMSHKHPMLMYEGKLLKGFLPLSSSELNIFGAYLILQ